MKKLSVIIAVLLLCAAQAFALNTPTGFVMSTATNRPNTGIRIQFDALDSLNRANGDTVTVRNAADSTIVFQYTRDPSTFTAAVDTTIRSLTPATQYIFIITVDSTNGVRKASTPDTLTTNPPDIDTYGLAILDRDGIDLDRGMRLATSNQTARIDTSLFTIVGATDTDSTVVCQAAKYTGFDYLASASGDSAAITLLIYAGGVTGVLNRVALIDSVNVTAPGRGRKSISFTGPAKYFYIVARGDAGNSVSSLEMWLNRDNR